MVIYGVGKLFSLQKMIVLWRLGWLNLSKKPNLETAQSYLDSGEYYWNSGMFLFRADRYIEELKKISP
ncbi:mannose-1-phosphate guanyltransferase [Salmonella enterica subsp. enterica]|nr:mannose-1-phosphate guanyltransferase [Salmonella enterica subsp. enterica] [Salmonella enterica subsp. enterica serovar Virchow]